MAMGMKRERLRIEECGRDSHVLRESGSCLKERSLRYPSAFRCGGHVDGGREVWVVIRMS
jgi:hypothetical protein